MKDKLINLKVNESVRDLAKELKFKYRYDRYDQLLFDCLIFFKKQKISPKEANTPLQKMIAETRNTLIAFQKTFENEKLLPTLFELKKQYLTVNNSLNEFMQYTIKKNNYLIELVENGNFQEVKKPLLEEIRAEIEVEPIKETNLDYNRIKELVLNIDQLKKGKYNGENNIFEFNSIEYNKHMDKLKMIIDKI